MTQVLVDSNVLLDVVTRTSPWYDWSMAQLIEASETGVVGLNSVVLAEITAGFRSPAQVDRTFPPWRIARWHLPWQAAFPAARAFSEYRSRGGTRTTALPDFFIGAHAQVQEMQLLTRDTRRFRTYLPDVALIHPE